jgi:hypothetical protein
LEIPNNFKTGIKRTFYDKLIKKFESTSSTDDEGWSGYVIGSKSTSFYGNVRFDNLAEIQEDYGLDKKIDIAITTDESVNTGQILEYEDVDYRVVSSIPSDSHNLILAEKWLSKSSTSTSV